MNRLVATRIVMKRVDREAVVASLGHPAYDLFAAGDRPANFYTWGSMGLASSLGLGLALMRPDLRVIVLDGDGSLLMNLGSLATIGNQAPPNLILLVWDNEKYGTTGSQATATSGRTNLAMVAKGAGISCSLVVRDGPGLEAALDRAWADPGPWVIVAKVEESAPTAKPPLDPVVLKHRFMEALRA